MEQIRFESTPAAHSSLRTPLFALEYLRDHPLLNEIFDKLERTAIERADNASGDDDTTRRVAMEEVNAIRNVRRELSTLAKGSTNPKPRGSVA